MKKVIHCLNHYLPHPIGGTEIYAVSLIKHLTNLGIQGKVLLPNYNSTVNAAYLADGIEVLKFAEPSIVDRELILGLRKPAGIKGFLEILKKENPAIVHFHELAGSNGITLHHVKAAKAAGFKVVFTFHLTGYTCKTGNLMYKEKVICDGVINISKCSACYLESKNMGTMTTGIVNQLSGLAYLLQYNTVKWKSKLGTALATPFLVASVKQILLELIDNCDQVISITQWYKNILISNQVDSDKIRFIAQGLPNPV